MLLKNVFLFYISFFDFPSIFVTTGLSETESSSPERRTFHSPPGFTYVWSDYVESAAVLVGDGGKATCITKAQNGRRADCDCREAGTESNRQIESDRLWCKSVIELFISPKNTSIINQRQSQACLLVRENNVGVAVGCSAKACRKI